VPVADASDFIVATEAAWLPFHLVAPGEERVVAHASASSSAASTKFPAYTTANNRRWAIRINRLPTSDLPQSLFNLVAFVRYRLTADRHAAGRGKPPAICPRAEDGPQGRGRGRDQRKVGLDDRSDEPDVAVHHGPGKDGQSEEALNQEQKADNRGYCDTVAVRQ